MEVSDHQNSDFRHELINKTIGSGKFHIYGFVAHIPTKPARCPELKDLQLGNEYSHFILAISPFHKWALSTSTQWTQVPYPEGIAQLCRQYYNFSSPLLAFDCRILQRVLITRRVQGLSVPSNEHLSDGESLPTAQV